MTKDIVGRMSEYHLHEFDSIFTMLIYRNII